MKLTVLFLTAGFLSVHANGLAQNVSFSGQSVPLKSVFTAVTRQTGFLFFYTEPVLRAANPVSIRARALPLKQFLDEVFAGQPLLYEIKDRNIFVSIKTVPPPAITSSGSPAPPIDIKGRIVNENGEPVLASIMIKGTNKGTTSNSNGYFELKNVDATAVLVISATNIDTREIAINGRADINIITVKMKTSPLDQVQIIAYGQTTKRFQTGNVTTVKGEDIEHEPVTNPLVALEGRVPGLVITQNSGVPGSGVTVRVQGRNSINGGNDPLYIIDGVPYPSQTLTTTTGGLIGGSLGILGTSGSSALAPGGQGNPLSFIGVDDIASIEVLKDADATSIYGSRGANGVILITTKKGGNQGKNKIDLNYQQGAGKVTRTIRMMNTQQFLEMRKEALANDGLIPSANPADKGTAGTGYRIYAPDVALWDSNRYTNWQKVLTGGTAHNTDANGSFSGGNVYTNYRIGGGYHRETTVFPGNFDNKKGTVNVSINNQSLNRRFSLQFSANYINDDNSLPLQDFMGSALQLPPNSPSLYNPDGTLNWAPNSIGNSSWTNPLAQLNNTYENTTETLNSSFYVGYKFTNDIEFKTQLGYNRLETDEFSGLSILSQKPETRASFIRRAQYTSSSIKYYLMEPQLNYTHAFGKAKVVALLGSTIQQNQNKGEVINGSGYPTDALETDIRSSTSVTIPISINSIYKYTALFSRINLNWSNKYILNITGRRDGSSRFGPQNRFHNFESAGGAWIFTEEGFFKKLSALSFGKIRATYGTTGNDQIGDYTYMDLYSAISNAVPYQNWSSISVNKLSNPYLQWEETRKLSIGLNIGLLNDRIVADISYNRNRSSNQLVSYSIPSTTGFSSILVNLPALVQNTTWEVSLNTINLKQKNFSWESNFNLTLPKNSLASFPGLAQTSLASFLVVGQPLNVSRAYHFLGVDPATGIYQFLDHNGKPTTSPTFANDRTVFVNPNPTYYGGLENTFHWKQLAIATLFQFTRQKQSSFALLRFGYASPPGTASLNQPASVLDRWQKPGDQALIQKYTTNFAAYTPYSNASSSDAGIVDASFARLKNIEVSYDLKADFLNKWHIDKFRLYVEGQNLLTITKFDGIDPENQASSALPPLKVLTVGANLQF